MTGTVMENAESVLSLGLGLLDAVDVLWALKAALFILLLLITVKAALGMFRA
jgi:hypothetical protein